MAHNNNITIAIENQGFRCEKVEMRNGKQVFVFESKSIAEEEKCPHCGKRVVGNGMRKVKLTDVPLIPGTQTIYEVNQHRYRCRSCKKTYTEHNPFKVKGFNLTRRCIEWIFQLMQFKIQTSAIAEILGIHWNTVRKLEKMRMDYILQKRDEDLKNSSYRPYYLAVDEFAVRKGHRYATCVMDLVTGHILWVGKGRTMKDFNKFFEEFSGSDYLSSVKAIAMDMNASYNTLVKQHLPSAEIVYDRYHVQAQFGRDVLGVVRLEEARKHKENAKSMKSNGSTKEEIKAEKKLYSTIKKARWVLLQNNDNLATSKQESLNEILESHSNLAVCYAMKEELCSLFAIRDEAEAREKWSKWFDAAIHSGIPPLEKFGRQKLKRLDGLVAHALFPINTGRLEGFNNKIKVAKRNSYGFRNSDFFFSFIRFLSLSSPSIHQKL